MTTTQTATTARRRLAAAIATLAAFCAAAGHAAPVVAIAVESHAEMSAKASPTEPRSIHSNHVAPADPLGTYHIGASAFSADLRHPEVQVEAGIAIDVDVRDAAHGSLAADARWSTRNVVDGHYLGSALPIWTYRFHADGDGVLRLAYDSRADAATLAAVAGVVNYAMHWDDDRLWHSLGYAEDHVVELPFSAGEHTISIRAQTGLFGALGTRSGSMTLDLDWSIVTAPASAAVPEPAPVALLAGALIALASPRRRAVR